MKEIKFIHLHQRMTAKDWTRDFIRMTDELKNIYQEDMGKVLLTMGITESVVENLSFTKENFIALQQFYNDQFDPEKQTNSAYFEKHFESATVIN